MSQLTTSVRASAASRCGGTDKHQRQSRVRNTPSKCPGKIPRLPGRRGHKDWVTAGRQLRPSCARSGTRALHPVARPDCELACRSLGVMCIQLHTHTYYLRESARRETREETAESGARVLAGCSALRRSDGVSAKPRAAHKNNHSMSKSSSLSLYCRTCRRTFDVSTQVR